MGFEYTPFCFPKNRLDKPVWGPWGENVAAMFSAHGTLQMAASSFVFFARKPIELPILRFSLCLLVCVNLMMQNVCTM